MARPNLKLHRKFRRLVAMLGLPATHVRGLLEYLWDAAYENGDAFVGDAIDVELAAEWAGEPGKLTDALAKCGGEGMSGFIDNIEGSYYIHDLWDHAPEYVRKRRTRELERQTTGKEIARNIPSGGRRRTKYAEWRTDESKRQPLSDERQTTEDYGTPPAPAPAPAPLIKNNKSRQAAPAIPENLNTEAFLKAWADWQKFRTEIKKKLAPSTMSRQLQQLASWGEAKAISAISRSISAGWQGLFEPTEKDVASQQAKAPVAENGLDDWKVQNMSVEQRRQYDKLMTPAQKEMWAAWHPSEVEYLEVANG